MESLNEAEDINIEIQVKDKKFEFSKKSLINSSDYFKAMFSNNFMENRKNSIEIQDTDPDAFKKILDFISSGSLSCIESISTCLSVLQCSSMLQFCQVLKICEDFLIPEINYENSLEIYHTCCLCRVFHIAERALTCALWECERIFETRYYLEMPLENVVDFLSKPELNLSSKGELTVFEGIYKWIYNNEAERECHLLKLLQCIDFRRVKADDFNNMMFYDLLSDNEQATLFLKKVKFARTNAQECEPTDPLPEDMSNEDILEIDNAVNNVLNPSSGKTIHRRTASMGWVSTYTRESPTRAMTYIYNPVVLCYDFINNEVEEICQLSKLFPDGKICVGYRVCSVGPVFYITGGQYKIGSNHWNNDVWSYCTITDKWKIHLSLPRKRRNHMVCVMGSVIYLMGGYGKHRVASNTMDAYDTNTGNWLENLPDLETFEIGAACVFKNRILIFYQTMILTYHPDKMLWTKETLTWSEDKKDSSREITFSKAMCYEDAVYLQRSYSQEIYRIYPDKSGCTMDYYNSFISKTENICLSPPNMFSFTSEGYEDSFVVGVIESIGLEVPDEAFGLPQMKREDRNESYKAFSKLTCWFDSSDSLHFPAKILYDLNKGCIGCSDIFRLEKGRLSENL